MKISIEDENNSFPKKNKNKNMCLDYVIKICTWIDEQYQ